jgi:hypothetical protein
MTSDCQHAGRRHSICRESYAAVIRSQVSETHLLQSWKHFQEIMLHFNKDTTDTARARKKCRHCPRQQRQVFECMRIEQRVYQL